MALSILDGNQSATTLSTIVTSGQHIPAHTVVSLGTQAITNISSAISGSTVCVGNLGLLQSTVATEGLSASGSFIKIGGHTGTSTTGNIVHVSSVGALRVDGSVYTQPVSIASVTIGNTVTIAGTVTANPTGTQTIAGTVTANVPNIQVCTQGAFAQTSAIQTALGVINENNNSQVLAVFGGEAVEGEGTSAFVQVRNQISGTVTIGSALPAGTNRIGVVTIGGGTVTIGAGTAQIGSVTVGNSVTIGSLPPVSGTVTANINDPTNALFANQIDDALFGSDQLRLALEGTLISGTVTANVPFFNFGEGISDGAGNLPIYGIQIGYADSISGEFQLVADNKPLPISGTVTANSSNGSLTTRFGSVTTANTAFATSAVTNANRKYLLIQNITTASNVITVGIGFTPTTTQGIQLFAGAGLTFEGSYIPTGAVNLLSSVTASCYTILEA